MRTNFKLILIAIALIIIVLFGFLFYRFNVKDKLSDIYFTLTNKSQTVGAVTANRGPEKIKITEITDAFWNTKTISPVIGKAYKIDRIEDDGRTVHVEFSYDPKAMPTGISPGDLRLYKWHDENGKKYWAMIKSRVDTGKNIISTDLNTFSVVAIKAPVWLVLTPEEKKDLTSALKEMQENQSIFTCGVTMMMEEELLTDEYFYSRSGDENYERHGCWNNDDVISVPYNYQIIREENGKAKSYYAQALVEWQIDPKESITLDGWVVDKNGEAVENARVVARKDIYGNWEQKTVTDKNGYYKLKLHSGEYTIRVISKDAKCSVVSAGNQFCYQGDISEAPFIRSRWQKDFTLKCGKYELSIKSKIISTSPTAAGPVSDTSEVHGNAIIEPNADATANDTGSITIDKYISGIAEDVECKQLKPFQYSFKVLKTDSLANLDKKELTLTLDFSENDEDILEEAYETNLIFDPANPGEEANARKHAEEAKQYNNFECDYIPSWAGHRGIAIISDRWLGDFVDAHSDEGINGSATRSASIFEIKDWEIVNNNGIWARKSYQRVKNVLSQSMSENTVLELKVLD